MTSQMTTSEQIKPDAQRIWVSDAGSVICDVHAGAYLKSAIQAKPKAHSHSTPLDTWSEYYLHLPGALPCEVCVDWSTLEI